MRAIKVFALRTGQHLITVASTSSGLSVVEGDESLFARLGLEKYRDLDGILRGMQRATELSALEVEWNEPPLQDATKKKADH